jgi:hypothetical protein
MHPSAKPKLAWHFDLHTPGNVRVNHNPDARGLARALKSAGMEEIITFAKCHYGYAYYPTNIGTRHPRMKGDAFGSVLEACRAEGIGVLAYISFGIDGQAGSRHREWQQLGKDLAYCPPDWGFISVCPFTPYLDRLMLPQIDEVIERYRPDGFWFDTMSALAPCYCRFCRASFRKEIGKEIPTEDHDPLQATFGRWRHERGIAMIERVAAFIHERLTGAKVGFNQIGSLPYPERAPKGVTVLSLDPPTYGPQSLQFSLNAAFAATTGMPCEVMPTIFNQGWGDWSYTTDLRIEQVAVSIWARGARLIYGDRLHPQIRLTPITQDALRFVDKLRRRVEKEFPSPDAELSPDALIVHNPSVTYGDRCEKFAMNPRERLLQISGAHELCLDVGTNFAVASEHSLLSWLPRVRLVVLPELKSIHAETEQELRRYVEQGGRMLIAGSVPHVNGKPLDWIGVHAEEKPWQDHIYLPMLSKAEKYPVLVRGDFHRVKLAGAATVLHAIPAYDATNGFRYGWGIGPACDKPSSHPALTCSKLGRGEVWWLGTPIFTDYAQHANWQQLAWFRALLARIKPSFRAWLGNPHGNV